MQIKLEVKDGGIFPKSASDVGRYKELRARSILAYGYREGLLTITTHKERDYILTTLHRGPSEPTRMEEVRFVMQNPPNTGMISVPEGENTGWMEQLCRLFLYTDVNLDVESAIRFYFAASFRWLSDNPAKTLEIARFFESQSA